METGKQITIQIKRPILQRSQILSRKYPEIVCWLNWRTRRKWFCASLIGRSSFRSIYHHKWGTEQRTNGAQCQAHQGTLHTVRHTATHHSVQSGLAGQSFVFLLLDLSLWSSIRLRVTMHWLVNGWSLISALAANSVSGLSIFWKWDMYGFPFLLTLTMKINCHV